jgi:hypothetical protein
MSSEIVYKNTAQKVAIQTVKKNRWKKYVEEI